jgi:predicted lysophospholipase L1 biosynthesis ABC-type transport system permease subunit
VGFASSFRAALGEETGVVDTCGVADDCGVTLAAGVLEALAVALGKLVVGLGTALVFGATVAVGAGFVFFSSFSRRPVLRSELCLAVKIVRRRVTPKNIPPR